MGESGMIVPVLTTAYHCGRGGAGGGGHNGQAAACGLHANRGLVCLWLLIGNKGRVGENHDANDPACPLMGTYTHTRCGPMSVPSVSSLTAGSGPKWLVCARVCPKRLGMATNRSAEALAEEQVSNHRQARLSTNTNQGGAKEPKKKKQPGIRGTQLDDCRRDNSSVTVTRAVPGSGR